MNDNRPVRYIRSIEDARSELPSIQECVNKMLRHLQTPFQCRLLPNAVVEMFCATAPLSVDFRHDTNWPLIQLSEPAARALAMPREVRVPSDDKARQVLMDLILCGIPIGAFDWNYPWMNSKAHDIAGLMLIPARLVAINRRRGE